jgi:hypothetical protein
VLLRGLEQSPEASYALIEIAALRSQ